MVNKKCQVFTPDEYAEELLDSIGYDSSNILGKLFLENSVGEGHILSLAVERYIQRALEVDLNPDRIKKELEKNFLAFEIDENTLEKCKINLDSVAIKFGIGDVKWNIINQSYLEYSDRIDADFIAGNPPYITYQEIDKQEREFIKYNFESCKQGKFDYCYAFIEKSIRDLKKNKGKMSYFIPSSIFKNAFGKKLREIILPNLTNILDYKHRRVFFPALISPAIIVIDNSKSSESFNYTDMDLAKNINLIKKSLNEKWIFSKQSPKKEIKNKFGDYFVVSNSVATLLNKIFVLKEPKMNQFIEKQILREAASPRSKTYGKSEKIIFPYYYGINGELLKYTEEEFREQFPKATEYLVNNLNLLLKRKADGAWFEYGRSQALTKINQEKLLLSSVITDSLKVYRLSKETIPYSGFFITPKTELSLDIAYDILNSAEFYQYIIEVAINANGKSVRISVNDIKEFGIDLFLEEKDES